MTRARYAYQSEQESILLPYYKRFVWEPALELIPAKVAPNTLTMISTLACGASFVLGATLNHVPAAMVASAFLVFTYLSLDNMDGAQARRCGRSSRLGEFLDHWLDTLNNGFVTLGAALAVGLPFSFALAVLAVGTLAFFSVQWELRQTGVFRMGRVADVEGNTAVCGLYLIVAAAGPGLFAWKPVDTLPPLSVWLGVGVGAQAVWTFVDAYRRTDGDRRSLLPITLCFGLLLTWAISGGTTTAAHLAIGFLANPVFTSRPVLGRLLERSTAGADWTAVSLVGAGLIASLTGLAPPSGGALAWGVAGAFATITAWHGLRSVATLRAEAAEASIPLRPADHGAPQP